MSKAKILVVEDEGIVAKDIQSRLRRLGYDVPATAATGEEAIARAEEHRPDVVLMDIMIQGDMDGIETAGKIVELLHIPIIYVTAYSDDNTLKRARMTSPFGYLLKPFAERELYTTIEMALYKHSVDQKLKENERWLGAILKSICDAVIATDLNGNVTFMNAVAETLTGWRSEDALGKNIHDVFIVINESSRERLETPVDTVIRQNSSVDLSNHAILIAKDTQERHIDNNAAPIRNENGEIVNIVLTFRDVTARRHAENKLQKSESQYQSLINSLPVVVYSISRDGNVEYLNPSFEVMSGWQPRIWLNKPFTEIIHPDDRPLAIQMFHSVMNGEIPPPYNLRVLTRSGEYRIGEFNSQPQRENGNITGKFGIVRDVTDEKKAQEALRQSEQHLEKTQLRLST
ncbi:MAG TPA: PAS domain S-box protein, partial [Candidatus Kapabacteria bacterium]|nr:PAS domain S-box protein [Candidatus Kapabacteria bacterium]